MGALPPGSGATKVTDGVFDPDRYRLSPEAVAAMEQNWRETMEASFGIRSYDEVVERLREV